MAYVYLAHWQAQADPDDSPYWDAPYPAFCVGRLDLRAPNAGHPIDRAPQGYGIFVYNQQINDPALYLITTDVHQPIGPAVKDYLHGSLNVPVQIRADKVKDVIWEIMTIHADPTGRDRVRPLMPKANGMMELHLGGFGKIKEKPLRPFHDAEWDSVLANLQHDYRQLRAEYYRPLARLLQRPNRFHYRKVLGSWMRKYRIDNPRLFIPPDLPYEGWLEPKTQLGDTFVDTNGTALASHTPTGPDAGSGWTNFNGSNLIDIEGNQADMLGSDSTGVEEYRLDDDLSSDDHYSEISVVTLSKSAGSAIAQVSTRKDSTSTRTFYMGQLVDLSGGSGELVRLTKRINGTSTSLGSDPITHNLPDTLRNRPDGSTIETLVNGVVKLTATDTEITNKLRTGLNLRSSSSNAQTTVDNFEAADLDAAAGHHRVGFGAGYSRPAS